MNIEEQARKARAAALTLQSADAEIKRAAILKMAEMLRERCGEICEANREDVRLARKNGRSDAFIDRLTLNKDRLSKIAEDLVKVAEMRDPVGEVIEEWTAASGLHIVKRRVPLGVIAIIYESRPNVTADAAALCLKAGNAVILRGGSDAFESNKAIMAALRDAVRQSGLAEDCVSLVMDTSRETADALMKMNGLVDVLIPRGGKSLIERVVHTATVPVIQTGTGVCHIYVDGDCDPCMAERIAVSAKISRPSVCNAAETLLVDERIAEAFLPSCVNALLEKGVEIRACERARAICPTLKAATKEDWDTEYNDLIYSVKVVDGVDQAISHINTHGSRHSEAIVTQNEQSARRFLSGVDAAAVYVNASTRYTDGGEFGFGAEIGISNQKLHARGPMGLMEITTYKYEITGDGQIR